MFNLRCVALSFTLHCPMREMLRRWTVRSLVCGEAVGRVLVLDDPLSLWGGIDPRTGEIIDRHHPQCGTCISGALLAMPRGRGSSSSSSVLLEAVHQATAPVGFLLHHPDNFIAVGAIVARIFYGRPIPVAVLTPATTRHLRNGDWGRLDGQTLSVGPRPGTESSVRDYGPVR